MSERFPMVPLGGSALVIEVRHFAMVIASVISYL